MVFDIGVHASHTGHTSAGIGDHHHPASFDHHGGTTFDAGAHFGGLEHHNVSALSSHHSSHVFGAGGVGAGDHHSTATHMFGTNPHAHFHGASDATHATHAMFGANPHMAHQQGWTEPPVFNPMTAHPNGVISGECHGSIGVEKSHGGWTIRGGAGCSL